MKISSRWVNEIIGFYDKTGTLPISGKPGRTPIPITTTEIELVSSFKKEFCLGAVSIKKIVKV